MYTKKISFCFILLLILSSCSNSSENQTELIISAASSLTDAMTEIIDNYEQKRPNTSITLNSASSGKLAQQIQQGAPVDLIISANNQWISRLETSEHIKHDSISQITQNSLVLISSKSQTTSVDSLESLTLEQRDSFALGDPDSVPVGTYAKQALEANGKWDELSDHFVYANDVKQVLAYVASNNAKYGLVYFTDAKISDKVEVLDDIDPNTHNPITYPAAVTSQSSHPKEAEAFLSYLMNDKAQETLKTYGFRKK
ncbi:molybdate ABC transporter substrate-binding protein [Halobacillus seohaensis]|uniref:Molybdate ABC transporter substrate-binding protein n=1 Tax=Halobacillus seohaensis TaxID=447421 RepID=A0ABW2EL46_9BACI